MLEDLGWDDFELASLNESAIKNERSTLSSGYVPPVISAIADVAQAIADAGINFQTTNDGETQIIAAPSANQAELATTGSTAVGNAGSSRVAIQYTLVFDEAEQQRKWYAFLRWLKSEPSLDGDTTAERILNFIEAHADF